MRQINNSDAARAIQSGANLQVNGGYPNQLGDTCVPTMDMTPDFHRIVNVVDGINASNALSATIITTPTDKDFYLTSAQLSMIKDVTATSVFSAINITLGSVVQQVLSIAGITLTVQSETTSLAFVPAIKLDRGTNVTVTNSTNTGNVNAWGCVTGYTVG